MKLPAGVTFEGEWRVEGVDEWRRCAFSGDGQWVLAGAKGGGALFRVAYGTAWRTGAVGTAVGWSATLKAFLADAQDEFVSLNPRKHAAVDRLLPGDVRSVAVSTGPLPWAAGYFGGLIAGSHGRTVQGHSRMVASLAFNHAGDRLLSAGLDYVLKVWDAASLALLHEWHGPHGSRSPWRARWLPSHSAWLTSGDDGELVLWSPGLAELRRVRVGVAPYGLALHPTLPIAACHSGTEVLLLNTETWSFLARWVVGQASPPAHFWPPLTFHPTEPLLVARGPDAASLARYRLDLELVLGRPRPRPDRRYQAAKVVLLGDSGVGKTGLGWVLAGHLWRETSSTHRRLVHPLGKSEGSDGGVPVVRETVLWDLAGQPGYRLVHHLHLRDVALALLVIDGSRESDPLAAARYWSRALARSASQQGVDAPPMLLVCARSDVGPVRLSVAALDEQARALGAQSVHSTSAREGHGVDALRNSISAAIRWDRVPIVHSDLAYAAVRDLVGTLQSEGALLLPTDALRARYNALPRAPSLDAEAFAGCLRGLANAGTLRWVDPVGLWLLQPEALDALAGALVHEAQREPDGLGSLAESRALAAEIPISDDVGVSDPATRRTLLRGAVEDLVSAEVAFRETGEDGVWLVFPTESTREHDELPLSHAPVGTFRFSGAVRTVYATTIVRLAHGGMLGRAQLYKDAAVLPAAVGPGEIAVRLHHHGDGDASLGLYARDVLPGLLGVIEGFVARHLRQRALVGSVSFSRAVACPECGLAVPPPAVERRRASRKPDVACSACDHRFLLPPADPGAVEVPAVAEMSRRADAARDRQTAALRLAGRRAEARFDAFVCYNSSDRREVRALHERLTAAGLHLWVDWERIKPGDSEIDAMEAIVGHAQAALVLLGPNGLGPWQDQERKALLRTAQERGRRLIPVLLPTWTDATPVPPLLKDRSHVDLRPKDHDHGLDPFERLVEVLGLPG